MSTGKFLHDARGLLVNKSDGTVSLRALKRFYNNKNDCSYLRQMFNENNMCTCKINKIKLLKHV